jgi:hypothetical protein
MMRAAVSLLAMIGAAAAVGRCHADAPPSAGGSADCAARVKPMVVGYFDHTAAWYRRQPRLGAARNAVQSWRFDARDALVVLYSDVETNRAATAGPGNREDIRRRIGERQADIAQYLTEAQKRGKVRVLLQLPPELARRWESDPETKDILREFVVRWSQYPALAGFYLFDEPEIKGVPVQTLQEMATAVRTHAPQDRNAAAISIAYSDQATDKPTVRTYSGASPPAFDLLLINRYPIYRAYGPLGRQAAGSMGAKLGLSEDKSRQEGLVDNEFANLHGYFESTVAAAHVPALGERPVYVSLQAYGLRDDCAGRECKATNESRPRRSPTWNELLYLFTSAWMSGADGAIFYSHYFSLYDRALRRRLDNFETLMSDVYRNLPACRYDVTVQDVSQGAGHAADPAKSTMARYAFSSSDARPDYLILTRHAKDRATVRIQFDRDLRVSAVESLRFDQQGNALDPVRQAVDTGGDGKGLRSTVDGFGVTILKLHYE